MTLTNFVNGQKLYADTDPAGNQTLNAVVTVVNANTFTDNTRPSGNFGTVSVRSLALGSVAIPPAIPTITGTIVAGSPTDQLLQFLAARGDIINSTTTGAAAATAFLFDGPITGTVGVPSTVYTLSVPGTLAAATTFTPISSGGTLQVTVGPKPNEQWGAAPEDAPPSLSDGK